MEKLLNCEQVAAWLRCSESTVKKMVRQKQIPCIKLRKGIRFIVSELEFWFNREME